MLRLQRSWPRKLPWPRLRQRLQQETRLRALQTTLRLLPWWLRLLLRPAAQLLRLLQVWLVLQAFACMETGLHQHLGSKVLLQNRGSPGMYGEASRWLHLQALLGMSWGLVSLCSRMPPACAALLSSLAVPCS